jgi:alcohol dehydrogenase
MLDFQMVQKVKVLLGNGAVKQLGELMTTMGVKKAFLVCDEGVVKAGIVQKAIDSIAEAGYDYFVYDKVQVDPPVGVIEDGVDVFAEQGCDVVIAVGGGSSIDTGKGINLLRYNDKPFLRFTDFSTPMNPSPGLIVIPTTSGTGSEISDGIVVTGEGHVKHPVLAVNGMAEYAIVDPELMIGMPPHLTASTGMDAFAHSVEGYTSNVANMFTDQICEGNMAAIIKWLPIAVQDGSNLEARGHMAVACSIGGWMLGYGHTNAGHSFAHVLGSMINLPHGFGVSYSEPWVLEFNAPAIPEKTRRVGELLGVSFKGDETPEEIGAKTRDALIAFRENLGIRKATEFEHDKERFPAIAKEIEGELFQFFNARKMTADDALEILHKMFA